ncbi:MAG: ferritin family protein [Candidatus Eisenbacteria bacterium]
MERDAQRMAAGLLKAMQAEREGQHFYRMASASTQDAQGRRIFGDLADDEREHEDFLKQHYESVLQTGKPDAAARLGPAREFAEHHPIFSEELRQRAATAHYEMTALSIGMQLELAAVNFYEGEAAAVSDATVKDFYRRLAAWERGHLTALQRQADELKEDYWNAAGFAPF